MYADSTRAIFTRPKNARGCPLITTPTDDIDERDDDDDDNGWFVGGVTTRSPTLSRVGLNF